MSVLDPLLPFIQRPTPACDPGFPMRAPGGYGRNDQHVVLDTAQDFIRNTADEHALEQGEAAGSNDYQIRANAACDLLDRPEG